MKKCHIGFLAQTVYRYYQGNGFGGAELKIVQFARMFAEAGYPVTIITNDYGQKDEEFQNGIRIVKIPLRFLGGNNLFFFWDCLVFLWKFRQLKLDYCLMKNPNSVLFLPGLAKIFCPRLKSFKIFASNGDCKIPSGFSGLLYRLGIKLSDGFIFQTETQKQES